MAGAKRVRASRKARAARRHRRLEGAAAVEFALILPLFSVLLLGLIDFGHFFFTMNTINNAAREAARRASVQTTTGDMTTEGTKAAQQYLSPAGLADGSVGGYPKNCNLNCPKVTVTTPTPEEQKATDARVKVEIKIEGGYKNITGFTYKVLPNFTSPFAKMTDLKSVSVMRWELAPNPS